MRMNGLTQFHFNDFRLSDNVRNAMTEALMKYDNNHNKLFDESQIIKALVGILKQDENEVAYFVKNVFRYDTDNDANITPQQFINFCLEQHFGEMAIQRLHRQKYYSRGSERIMNLEEFQNTLNYCLGKINSTGTHNQYSYLFREVDFDQDGYITYQQYFMFLRQYFGSQRKIPSEIILPESLESGQSQSQDQYIDMSGLSPQERFANLIYSQFKLLVMNKDQNRNLIIEQRQISDILSSIFGLNFQQKAQFQSSSLTNSTNVEYEDFIKKTVVFYICEIDPKKNIFETEVTEANFIEHATRATSFVGICPTEDTLRQCFKSADVTQSGVITKNTYINTMRKIFSSHKLDKRGLGRRTSYN